MQKIRIIGFLFKKIGYIGSLKGKKVPTNGCCRPHIYLPANITLILNSMYVFDNWGKKLKP
jgi:hypothetical protein